MKIVTKVKCPGCRLRTDVQCKKPGFMSPVFLTFECDSCESKVSIKLAQNPKDKTSVMVSTLSLTPSMLLMKMLAEEEEEKKKGYEEAPAEGQNEST